MYKLLIKTPPAYVDNVTVSFDIFKIRIFKVIFYSNGLFRSFINEVQPPVIFIRKFFLTMENSTHGRHFFFYKWKKKQNQVIVKITFSDQIIFHNISLSQFCLYLIEQFSLLFYSS